MGSKLLKRGGQRRDRREIIIEVVVLLLCSGLDRWTGHGGGSLTDSSFIYLSAVRSLLVSLQILSNGKRQSANYEDDRL